MPVVDNVVNHMKATVVPLYQVYSRPPTLHLLFHWFAINLVYLTFMVNQLLAKSLP